MFNDQAPMGTVLNTRHPTLNTQHSTLNTQHSTLNPQPSPMHVVFSGGGTGGHLFPGLAVAAELRGRQPNLQITFCGNGQEFDRRQVDAAGFAYRGFPCSPLKRTLRGTWDFVRRNLQGAQMAGDFLRRQRVTLVVGLGGYASVPVARAAGRQNIPLVLLEQNVISGRATRWLARSANLVCVSFDATCEQLPSGARPICTGNPVRLGFVKARPQAAATDPRRLVVLGGSRGAADLNEHVPRALYKLRDVLRGWRIEHVCGTSPDATRGLYQRFDLNAGVREFVGDMPSVLAGASLAVSRAGGTTLAELSMLGIPAVLIPYPFATDDHQSANAGVFAQSGGAAIVDSRTLSGRLDTYLADALFPLLSDPPRLRPMRLAMRGLCHPNATADIADNIRRLLRSDPQADAA
jgi:UDP-N-acetylglucosamine--N-acetylmuramyl-(pentapeptide) pyrophosphoryl-undecaprenol N-acetylglucosamine transferase